MGALADLIDTAVDAGVDAEGQAVAEGVDPGDQFVECGGAEAHHVQHRPEHFLHELGDSSVNFVVRPWVNTADYWAVYWDITRAVKEEFDKASVSIPFPQTDVHVHQVAAATA